MKKEKGILMVSYKKYANDSSIFDVKKADGRVKLIYSALDECWTNPGTTASKLKCTGYGYVFTSYSEKKGTTSIEMDYAEAHELWALLMLIDESGSKFKYVKK